MKKSLIILLFLVNILTGTFAQTTILEARQMPLGTVVTVTGIATNGSELGIIRYFQDETAGIAAYGSLVGSVNRGDEITVTGTLKNYNQLLELDPLTSVVVNSTGNPLPEPIVLTPIQISEQYESKLLKINNIEFSDAGQEFIGNTNYQFTANGETGFMRVKTGQDLVGTIIPTGPVNLTAICSQYDYSNPNEGYQLLPRDLNDISLISPIYLTSTLNNTAFTKTTLDFSWETNISGSTELYYGPTAETVTTNYITSTGGATTHNIGLSDLNPGEITWVLAFTVDGSDTAKSAVLSFATISNSGGDIKAYFNSPVDLEYSNGVDAIYLPSTIDDTLIKYIERAKYTIDFTIYNFNNSGISNISDALIAAANSGLRVRVIGCGTTANLGIDELLGTSVHVLIGPDDSQRDGIMHNKFVVFDAESADPNDPIVWTGSTNFTDGQINLDANNVIIVQDQSLARTYQIEFEEMWGSYGDEPDPANALFGAEKRNNTPHEFIIDGKYVECYFSPSDGVNSKIVEVINTADNDLSVATMLMTRIEMANAIADRKSAGVAVNVITNAEGNNNSTVNTILSNSLTTHYTFDDVSNGILHHKYMIVDQYPPASDPMVFTGSHNWSASADNINDENTLIVHDATLSNIYYQQFVHRFEENLGILFELSEPPTAVTDLGETGINELITVAVLDNDIIEAPVTVSIEQMATQGSSYIPFSNPNVISYLPDPGFEGQDSIVYKIVYKADPTLFATAKVYFTVIKENGIGEYTNQIGLNIYPNPASDYIILNISEVNNLDNELIMTIANVSGQTIYSKQFDLQVVENSFQVNTSFLDKGIYIIKFNSTGKTGIHKLIIR